MDPLLLVILYTGLAGAMIPLGALLGAKEHLRRGAMRHGLLRTVVAFGGGVILAAVALVLVPEGLHQLKLAAAAGSFLLGGVAFLLVDRAIEKRGGAAGQLLAMLLDFVPESIALGAAFATGGASGPLLAILIGFQNLPEGFNSFRELRPHHARSGSVLARMAPLALLGPAAGLAGFFLLSGHPTAIGAVMLFASGGILYLIFQDVAPLAHEKGHWVPTLGALLGFLVGIVAQKLL